jgi:alkyl sulfatase BDS1-like metallo-beta-lactamase superfamily hydrolase
MGGADAVLDKAREAYDRGEYRWVAEVVNHVVFAEPQNQAARALQANTLEQLGYQSEAGTWRNLYLTGAQELRDGTLDLPLPSSASPDAIKAMSLDLFFNYLGVRLNGAKAGDVRLALNWVFTDTGEQVALLLSNGGLSHVLGRTHDAADATVTLTRAVLNRFILGQSSLDDEAKAGEIAVERDVAHSISSSRCSTNSVSGSTSSSLRPRRTSSRGSWSSLPLRHSRQSGPCDQPGGGGRNSTPCSPASATTASGVCSASPSIATNRS